MANSFNHNSGRFYELLEALKSEYELYRQSSEALPRMSKEDYEIKGTNHITQNHHTDYFSTTVHG